MIGAATWFARARAVLGNGRVADWLLPRVASCYALRAALALAVVIMW
jgi:IMP cyclohydrolase